MCIVFGPKELIAADATPDGVINSSLASLGNWGISLDFANESYHLLLL
jgi:hypothetical protein